MNTYKLNQSQVDLLKNLCLDCIQEMEKYTNDSVLAIHALIEQKTATTALRRLNRPLCKPKKRTFFKPKQKGSLLNTRMEREFVTKFWN